MEDEIASIQRSIGFREGTLGLDFGWNYWNVRDYDAISSVSVTVVVSISSVTCAILRFRSSMVRYNRISMAQAIRKPHNLRQSC